jgi:hypothetical protein
VVDGDWALNEARIRGRLAGVRAEIESTQRAIQGRQAKLTGLFQWESHLMAELKTVDAEMR